MTTVANNEKGQSLLEFLLVLPLLLGLVALMTRVNSAIQASLVYQQYARAQTTWLTFNSPVYPALRLQYSELNVKNYNQMTIGVSDNLITGDSNLPTATTANIARNQAVTNQGSNADQIDGPTSRAIVRVRNTVTMCTQTNVAGSNPVLPIIVSANGVASVTGPYNLPESTKFNFCTGAGQ
jgi:hypothetical protein